MRGPMLSGPLGSSATLDAVARWVEACRRVVVIGPPWLGAVLSRRVPVLLLTEPEERPRARRAARRAAGANQTLLVALAGADLPLRAGSIDALLVEGASTLDVEAMTRWLATLVPAVRPGGHLIALDTTESPAVEASLAGSFLAAALTDIVQERPRDGVVLTVGIAPPGVVVAARFGDPKAVGNNIATDSG